MTDKTRRMADVYRLTVEEQVWVAFAKAALQAGATTEAVRVAPTHRAQLAADAAHLADQMLAQFQRRDFDGV